MSIFRTRSILAPRIPLLEAHRGKHPRGKGYISPEGSGQSIIST